MKTKLSNFITLMILFNLIALPAFSAEYSIDPDHSMLDFQVRHLLSKVSGRFKDFEGNFSFDERKPDFAKVKVTAKAASIDTSNEKRDTHLRSADFFDVEKFPALSFEGKKLTATGDKKFKFEGNLTIHGVTKLVTFDIDYLGADKDPAGKVRAGFTATTKINRKDYGLMWNKTLESGNLFVGDEVTITTDIEAVEKK